MLHARQREMRTKRTTLDLESDGFTGNLHVVMKQLEARVLSNADPYDASPPKVWESANPANVHHELAMPSRDRREDIFDLADAFVGLLAEELEGEMNLWLANPGEVGGTLTKRLCRIENGATDFGREVDRQEETHAISASIAG